MENKMNFEYVKGQVKTNVPWVRPCPHRLNKWKENFFKIPHVNKYKFWVCGGVTQLWETWDIDILATGKINEYSEIENIMISATQIGFEYRQLIDITWNEHYEKYALQNVTNPLQGPTVPRQVRAKSIVIANKITKNGKILTDHSLYSTKLSNSLWEVDTLKPTKKQIDRIKDGIFYKSPQFILLTPDLDFKEIVAPHPSRINILDIPKQHPQKVNI